jgi:hypothetical protein
MFSKNMIQSDLNIFAGKKIIKILIDLFGNQWKFQSNSFKT